MKNITLKLNIFDFLTKLNLFANLSKTQLEEIAKLAKTHSYKKNALIFTEGEKAQNLFVVYSGVVKIYKISKEGKEHIIQTMGTKQIFAEVPMYEAGNYPASCAALENTILIAISRDALLNLLAKEPKLALNLLAIQSRRMRQLTEHIEELTLQDTYSRVVIYLLKNADEHGIIQQKFSITDLAKILGMTRENLSKILHGLAGENIISLEKKRIIIIDKVKIHKMTY